MDGPPHAGDYRVIYADPPWRFATYSDKGKGRSAEAHYDCLSIDEIKRFPVAQWVAPRCGAAALGDRPLAAARARGDRGLGVHLQDRGLLLGQAQQGGGEPAVARVAAAGRARLLHRARLLDPGQPRALPAGDARPSQAQRGRRAEAADRAAPRAFAQARRDLRAHRAAAARAVSRAVRAPEPAGLGQPRQPGGAVRPGPGRTRRRPSRGL